MGSRSRTTPRRRWDWRMGITSMCEVVADPFGLISQGVPGRGCLASAKLRKSCAPSLVLLVFCCTVAKKETALFHGSSESTWMDVIFFAFYHKKIDIFGPTWALRGILVPRAYFQVQVRHGFSLLRCRD